MLLARHGGKQNSRNAGWTRKRVDGAAQGELQLFGVQMLLEYLELAAHPGLAHGAIERGDRLDDEALDPLALQQIRQRRMESGRVVCFEKSKDVALHRRCERLPARMHALFRERIQVRERLRNEFARPQPGIHQSLDGAKLGELVGGVLTLGVLIASRVRETVAPLPDAQHILRQPRLALYRADVEACLRILHTGRFVQDNVTRLPRERLFTSSFSANCPRQTGVLYYLVFREVQRW